MDIYILNNNFDTVAIIDSYESLIWTDRYYEYGDFEIVISPHSDMMQFLIADNYIWRSDSEHVMIIEKIVINTDSVESPKAYITGRSLESILCSRVIDTQTVLKGSFQQGIQTLLDQLLINPQDSARKISNFIFKSSGISEISSLTLDAQYFGENLYDVVSNACANEQIGFKVTLSDSNQFVFELYKGADRSYDQTSYPYVIFSPHYDNLINSQYVYNVENIRNVAYICGEEPDEDSEDQQIIASTGTAKGLGRKEIFVDGSMLRRHYRDDDNVDQTIPESEYETQLIQKGKEELSEYRLEETFDGQVESSFQWVIGKDYFMGDIVQIENEYGKTARSRVVEMITSDSAAGLEFYPSFEAIK